MSNNPTTLTISDGTVTFTDQNGRTYTASDVEAEPGDAIGVEYRADGVWAVTGEGERLKRYPLRHGDDPHFTEMTAIITWPSPFLSDDGGSTP